MKASIGVAVLLCLCTAVFSGSLEAQVATHIVISEVLINGSGSAELDEYIELYNPTSSGISLAGDTLFTQNATGGSRRAYALGGSVPAYGFYLITDSLFSIPGDFRDPTMSLTNSGGSVYLRNGSMIDAVGWGSAPLIGEGAPLAGSPAELTSYERKAQDASTSVTMSQGGSDEGYGNGWDTGNNSADFILRPAGTGEPQNTASLPEPPPSGAHLPEITSVSRAPFIPPAGGSDSVYATITDQGGSIAGARLHLRTNGGAFDSSLVLSQVSGSLYAAVIPASSNAAAGDLVEYYVSATDDSSGYTSTASSLQGYFVGDAPIAFIKAHPAAAIGGYGLQVYGILNVGANVLQEGAAYLQDSTGGIRMYHSGLPGVEAGRSARIQGELGVYEGGYEVSGTDFRIVDSTGTQPLLPLVVTLPLAPQSPTNGYEGRLVKILSLSTGAAGLFVSGNAYAYATGSSDTISVLAESNGSANTLIGASVPPGPVDGVGVLQYAGSFLALVPRRAEDMGTAAPVTYEAVATGNWSDTLTWSGHRIPGSGDDVTMSTLGVTVTVDIADAACRNLSIAGSGTAPNSGPLLQFIAAGAPALTVNGTLSVSGGSGGGSGDRGGRAKLSSNGNVGCTLVVRGNILSTPSNAPGNGSAGVNMNEGTVRLAGAQAESLKNDASLRLGNLEIGDGIVASTVRCAPTSGGTTTIYLRSLKVRSGAAFWIGSGVSAHPSNLGDAANDTLPHWSGGIVIDPGASLLVQQFGAGSGVSALQLDGGGISNDGTLDLQSGGGATLNVGVNGGLPRSHQVIGGSQAGHYAAVMVGLADTLSLERDMLVVSPYKVSLSGTLLESPGNTVIGTVEARRKVAASVAEPFGEIGVTVMAAGADPETTTVTRTTGVAQAAGGHTSILRYFDIAPAVNGGLNATLQFSYDESELSGQVESTLVLWKSTNAGNSWNAAGGSVNAETNVVTATGVNSFSRWTAADADHPLGGATENYFFGAGWNMISLPLTVADYRTSVLFPGAVSAAFAYVGGYAAEETLANRSGYWLKFSASGTVPMFGAERILDTIDVFDGWNLVGSVSCPVAVNAIQELPAGLVAGPYFGYNGSYVVADTIFPARAYWVKVNGTGKLVLSCTPPASSEGSGR